MSKLKYAEWQTSYEDALLESDRKKLKDKIHLAEWKIFGRLQTISADTNHHEEKVAIADALNKLRSLKFGPGTDLESPLGRDNTMHGACEQAGKVSASRP
jgi:hypothetical protein